MRWIEIKGDAYAIGYQLGELAREAFVNVLERIDRYQEVQQVWGDSSRLTQLEAVGRAQFPELMREIEGIADGASMPFRTVFAWNCRGDLPGGGEQTGLAGCTDVMGFTPDGPVMAHNEDDQAELDGHCAIVDIHPEHGLPFISFYSPGLLPGHTFGWNQAGLVQTINHLRTEDQQIGLPRHLLSRAVLNCADIDAAIALIAGTDRAGAFHHNLGQAGDRGRLVSVEAAASGIAVQEITGVQVHANHLVSRALSQVPQTIAPSSAARQSRAAQMCATGLTSAGEALSVLADESNPDWPIRRKRIGSNDPGFTLASAVFQLQRERVRAQVFLDPREPPVFDTVTAVN